MTPDAWRSGGGSETPAYDPAAYGDALGPDYDTLYPPDGLETAATVALLTELAKRHAAPSVLELGIGTGRLALELQREGLSVAGVEASERMVAALRSKPGSERIEVAVGDYVSTRVPGAFAVVALIFNNILDPRGLPAQLRLFQNAARHLVTGGFFVIEAFVLSEEDRDGNWHVLPRYVGDHHVELQLARFNPETNTLQRTLVHLRHGGADFVSVRDCYSGPGELDVMAHVSGLRRVARYASWERAPFTAHSRRHVTIYERV